MTKICYKDNGLRCRRQVNKGWHRETAGRNHKKAYPWSFNRVGFPYYCAHAYFLNELFKELGLKIKIEYGRQYDDKGNKIDEPCKYIVYK